ncbi:MAG: hypothetical protein SNJ72_00800 [Fimbriimonadales bacterium]
MSEPFDCCCHRTLLSIGYLRWVPTLHRPHRRHPSQTEQPKPDEHKGKYIHPELFGQPKEKGIHYHPELERLKPARPEPERPTEPNPKETRPN